MQCFITMSMAPSPDTTGSVLSSPKHTPRECWRTYPIHVTLLVAVEEVVLLLGVLLGHSLALNALLRLDANVDMLALPLDLGRRTELALVHEPARLKQHRQACPHALLQVVGEGGLEVFGELELFLVLVVVLRLGF